MDDVATAAGVTKPIVYRHFSSKADLIHSLIWRLLSEALPTLTEQFQREAQPREALRAVIGGYLDYITQNREAVTVLIRAGLPMNPEYGAQFASLHRGAEQVVRSLSSTNLDRNETAVLGWAFFGYLQGVSAMILQTPHEIDPAGLAKTADLVTDIIFSGLRSQIA